MLWTPSGEPSARTLRAIVECKIEYLPNYNKAEWGPLQYAHEGDSGVDLRSALSVPIFMESRDTAIIPTGIKVAIPKGTELQVRSRSGLSSKSGIIVLNSPGTVDSTWRGEIGVILHNASKVPFVVNPGDRVAQMVLCPVFKAEWTETVVAEIKSDRGENGFGSTGVK